MNDKLEVIADLVELSRELGRPENDYAILAEGNTSTVLGPDRFLLKASGTSLQSAAPGSFVEMRMDAVLKLLDDPPGSDQELSDRIFACKAEASELRPSVEAGLHALALTVGGARFVGHTHPTAVNGILCSEHAEALSCGAVFPDQIVVCGSHPLFVPYVDPGVPLALAVRERLLAHRERHGAPPKMLLLQNHGLFAFGRSGAEVLRITAMAVKAARILLGTFATGGPRYLPQEEAERIESRPDEHYRRGILDAAAGLPGARPDSGTAFS